MKFLRILFSVPDFLHLAVIRGIQSTTVASGMLLVPFAEMKEFLVYIKDLEQHCWYVLC